MLVDSYKQTLLFRSALSICQAQRSTVSMNELCIALTELVHTHIDLKDYALAKDVCGSTLYIYKLIQGVNFMTAELRTPWKTWLKYVVRLVSEKKQLSG